jgi:hypothetical protein
MPMLTNNRHELFAQAIAAGKSHYEAYESAGFTAKGATASACATRLLKDAKVAARVAELQQKNAQTVGLTKQWVLEKLVENVHRAMPPAAAYEYKYEGSVANRALELLGKELGMFIDRKEVGQPGEFEAMEDAALFQALAEEAQKLGMALEGDPRFKSKH